LEEPDGAGRVGCIGVKVGPGEAEHDTDVISGEENGVDRQAFLPVHQGNHQRQNPLVQHHPADDVRGLVAVKGGGPHLDGARIPAGRQTCHFLPERLGGEVEVALAILERAGKVEIVQHPVERGDQVSSHRVVPQRELLTGGTAVVLAVEELGCRIHTHGPVNPAGDRIEECPGDLAVGAPPGQPRVALLERRPSTVVVGARSEELGDVSLHPTDELGVELEPFPGILLATGPVLPLEPRMRATSHQVELVPVGQVDLVEELSPGGQGGGAAGQRGGRGGDVRCFRG